MTFKFVIEILLDFSSDTNDAESKHLEQDSKSCILKLSIFILSDKLLIAKPIAHPKELKYKVSHCISIYLLNPIQLNLQMNQIINGF